MTLGSLLLPALNWDAAQGFEHQRRAIDSALAAGVGGFVVYGGPRAAVTELTAELHDRSSIPLLIAADVERGAGQQFDGAVALPPLGALGFFENPAAMRRAGQITARDLKRMGVNWALAPVCELDVGTSASAIGTRSVGADPDRAGAMLAEWIDGCQAEGVMACAKNFPGTSLVPFHAAADAGVASVQTPATLLTRQTHAMLRDHVGFDGLIACSALDLGDNTDAAAQAIANGCDVLLLQSDFTATARALDIAAQRGPISSERSREALERRDRWASWARPGTGREPSLDDEIWIRQVADASVHLVRGAMPRVGHAAEVVLIDDDTRSAAPASNRAHFAAALRELEIEANVLEIGSAGTRVPVLIAVFADAAAEEAHPGFTRQSCERVQRVLDVSRDQKRDTLVAIFSHPRHSAQFPGAPNVLCAWGGDPPMQTAAARVIARAQLSGR